MILQKDERALLEITKFGDYYMTLLWFANKYTNLPLGFPFINDFYERCQEKGFIKDNLIQDPSIILRVLHFNVLYLGHLSTDYICKRDEFEILHYKKDQNHHFVAGNGRGIVTYDPNGFSEITQFGELYNKKVFKTIINGG